MKTSLKIFGTFFIFILFLSNSWANQADSTKIKIDELFKRWNKIDSPGASVIVLKDNQVVYKNGYGSAQLEYDIPIRSSTVFHVASVSKQFTAFAIVLLAEQGKLSFDDDIRKHLPEVPDFGKTITIRHLVHHISGLRDQWELLAMAGWRLDDVITKNHIVKMVKNQKELNFEPGERYLYCNTGFTLLAEIVARVSGQTFPEWTKENIFDPLEMKNTHFHDDHELVVKNRAYSYKGIRRKYKNSVLSYANVGATSLFTTVEDLAKWMQNFEDAKVGGQNVINQMLVQGVINDGTKINYSFGLSVGEHKGFKTVGHGGSDAGFRSHIVYFPEQNLGVVVLSNLASFNASRLAFQVADIFLNDPSKPEENKPETTQREEIKVNPEIFKAFIGKYKLMPGFVLTVLVEDEKLMVEATGQQKVQLFPESETKYFLKVTDAQVTFKRDDQENVPELILHQGGQDRPAKRMAEFVFDQSNLKDYVGKYYSEELETFYSIVVQDSQLVAVHQRHDDISITFSSPGVFTGKAWWFQLVNFTKDSTNKIDGFMLTGGRVINLKFKKIKLN